MSGWRPEDFDFALPPESIAQHPPAERGSSRMLVLDRVGGSFRDGTFGDLPGQLRAGDVLVMNDTRVILARLFGNRVLADGSPGEGRVEALLLEQHSPAEWSALMRPGRALRAGQRVRFRGGGAVLEAEVTAHGERGERRIRFSEPERFWERLDAVGHMPLPPYIRRDDAQDDGERYQTVIARERGSAAAPTAGLHFTPEMLDGLRAAGVEIHTVTLHVGLGTFQPLTEEAIRDGRLHEERYTLPGETATAVNAARREGRRVVAVGTTVVRTLEHCGRAGGTLEAHSGRTSIFIQPGFDFRVVGALLTNFHLPQSSLLMLVSAFAGRERTLAAYRHAVDAGYRFFSYGDCMFIA